MSVCSALRKQLYFSFTSFLVKNQEAAIHTWAVTVLANQTLETQFCSMRSQVAQHSLQTYP